MIYRMMKARKAFLIFHLRLNETAKSPRIAVWWSARFSICRARDVLTAEVQQQNIFSRPLRDWIRILGKPTIAVKVAVSDQVWEQVSQKRLVPKR